MYKRQYLARLDGLRGAHGVAAEGEVELSPRSLAELEKLANRLKKRREAGIGKLMALLVARGKRLDRLSRKMEAAFAPRLPAKASSLAEEMCIRDRCCKKEATTLRAGHRSVKSTQVILTGAHSVQCSYGKAAKHIEKGEISQPVARVEKSPAGFEF